MLTLVCALCVCRWGGDGCGPSTQVRTPLLTFQTQILETPIIEIYVYTRNSIYWDSQNSNHLDIYVYSIYQTRLCRIDCIADNIWMYIHQSFMYSDLMIQRSYCSLYLCCGFVMLVGSICVGGSLWISWAGFLSMPSSTSSPPSKPGRIIRYICVYVCIYIVSFIPIYIHLHVYIVSFNVSLGACFALLQESLLASVLPFFFSSPYWNEIGCLTFLPPSFSFRNFEHLVQRQWWQCADPWP